MTDQQIMWVVFLALFLLTDIMTSALITIWFAAGALVAGVASYFGASLIVQVALFVSVSLVMLLFTRPIAKKYFNSNRQKTNLDSIKGSRVKVLETIDNDKNQGKVLINGVEWTARAVDDVIIEEGSYAEVKEISGVKVMVVPWSGEI